MNDAKLDRKKLELTDGNITLRPNRKQYTEENYRAIRDSIEELSPWLPFAHKDYSIKESRDWIKKQPGEWKRGMSFNFVIFDNRDGSLVGGCGLNGINKLNKSANLGYWVRTRRTGRGIAPAASRLLAKWGFEVLKLQRIEIVVATENQRSLRVAEKAGAKREGVLRNRLYLKDKPHDAVMHSLIPGDIQ